MINGRLFTSGLVSDRPGGLESETHRIFQQALAMFRDAGISPADVVRTRAWYIDEGGEETIRDTHGVVFDHPGPVFSAVRASALSGDAAVLVELEAVAGAGEGADRFESVEDDSTSGAVRYGRDVWIGGERGNSSTHNSAQVATAVNAVQSLLSQAGVSAGDVAATRHFMRSDTQGDPRPDEWSGFMSQATPTSAGIAVAGVGERGHTFMLEADAVADASSGRNNFRSGRSYEVEHNYCRAVRVDGHDVLYIGGTTSIKPGPGEVIQSPDDIPGQIHDTLEIMRWAAEQQGFTWEDFAKVRAWIVGGQSELDQAAGALSNELNSIDAAIALIGVPMLGRPGIVVELEATLVRPA
jgi:enamine deaminase RidA (YjgF/YER057c/UK114 family)